MGSTRSEGLLHLIIIVSAVFFKVTLPGKNFTGCTCGTSAGPAGPSGRFHRQHRGTLASLNSFYRRRIGSSHLPTKEQPAASFQAFRMSSVAP